MTSQEGYNNQNSADQPAAPPQIRISEPESEGEREIITELDVVREAAKGMGAIKTGDTDALELEEKLHQRIIDNQPE